MNPTKKFNSKKDSNEHTLEFGDKLTKKQKQVAWRREKVFSSLVKGITNTYELADVCNTSQSTIVRDISFLKKQSVEQMKFHIHERVPWAYRICSEGINEVLKQAWSLLNNKNTRVNKAAVLELILKCYKDQLEISTNALVITQALEQVEYMKDQIIGFYNPNQTGSKDSLSTPLIAPVR